MANTSFFADSNLPVFSGSDWVRRAVNALGSSCATIIDGITEERERLRLERSLRGLTPHQLRDIGIDRSGV